ESALSPLGGRSPVTSPVSFSRPCPPSRNVPQSNPRRCVISEHCAEIRWPRSLDRHVRRTRDGAEMRSRSEHVEPPRLVGSRTPSSGQPLEDSPNRTVKKFPPAPLDC